MDLRLGVVGRGYWGQTYIKVLSDLGLRCWQAGRDWRDWAIDGKLGGVPDGLIIACSTDGHYEVARDALRAGLPVLVEKPLARCERQAQELLDLSYGRGIAFVSHTRLYADEWREFKRGLPKVDSVEAWAGGVNDTNPDAVLNWAAHLVPMCLDIGFCPRQAIFHITKEKQPLRFVVNGTHAFQDGKPGALKNLVREFCEAIERGVPDNRGLLLGLEVVKHTEALKRERRQ